MQSASDVAGMQIDGPNGTLRIVDHDLLLSFLACLDAQPDQPGRVLLVTQRIQVFGGSRLVRVAAIHWHTPT